MRYRLFGNTGISVSEVGVGCGPLGGPGKTGLEPALRRAFDLGVNLFDTADMYAGGASEDTLGRVFADVPRDKIVWATKFGTVREAGGGYHKDVSVGHMKQMFEQSLRRLRTDHVDIYQLHNPPMTCLDDDALWRELDRMLDAGKIRCYGLSIDLAKSATAFLDRTRGRGLQMVFNPLNQEPRAILGELATRGVGMLVKVPMAGGALTDRFSPDWPPVGDERRQRWGEKNFAERLRLVNALRPILCGNGRMLAQGALAWLLTISPHVIPIPGISSLARIEETVGAAGMRLSDAEMKAIDELEGGGLKDLRFGW
ncbi:MAG: aldo/keto reductase [Phycisphaerae bacterium]|nr:aldo/keto reductase [Phycisphaerae bacterium]